MAAFWLVVALLTHGAWAWRHPDVDVVGDSALYLAAADALRTSGSLTTYTGGVYGLHPPAFPVFLALTPHGTALGFALMGALLAWVWALAIPKLTGAATGALRTTIIAPACLLSGAAVVSFGAVRAEVLYLPVSALALWAVARDLQAPHRRSLVTAAGLVALLPLIRTAGLVAPLVAVGAVALTPGLVLRDRVRRMVGYGMSLLPFGGWMLRNQWLTGRPLGMRDPQHHAPTGYAWQLVEALGALVVPDVADLPLYAGCCTIGVLLITLTRTTVAAGARVCALWIAAHVVALLLAVLFWNMEPPGIRYMAPLLGPVLVLFSDLLVPNRARPLHRVGGLALFALLGLSVGLTGWTQILTRAGSGVPHVQRDRAAVQAAAVWLEGVPADAVVASNRPDMLYGHARRRAEEPLRAPRCRLRDGWQQHPVALIWFDATPDVSVRWCTPEVHAQVHGQAVDIRGFEGGRAALFGPPTREVAP